ncbi:MAG: GNAT family N-acetyltransferase [Candidatus Levybacteria bacterium]|nr:GNAT family N-acetyltransferase [Candidatus Levybacteria bacterium]
MEDMVTIRSLETKDVDALSALFEHMLKIDFPEYSEKTKAHIIHKDMNKEAVLAIINSARQRSYGAFMKDELIGFVLGEVILGGVALCSWIMIKPQFHGKGIGRDLMAKFESAMKELGVHSVHLYSAEWNKPFYEKLGYELVGLYKGSWYGSNDYLYVKLLQEPKEENFLKA